MAERLTDALVKRFPVPAQGSKVFWDSDVAGFGARITAAGARALVFNYRTKGSGRERRLTIGGFPNWTVGAARIKARELRRLVDQGGDPLADLEDERAAPDMADLADRFEAEHLVRKRASTAADYRSVLDRHIRPALRHLKVADVEYADIDRLHRKLTAAGHPRRANTAVAILSKMFGLSIRWGMRADNPCRGVEKNTERARRRYLSGDELKRLVAALAAHPDQGVANIVRILLLTGCRRGEALAMRWADLDLTAGTWSKPASSTKQDRAHEVPLSAPARQLLAEIRDRQTRQRRPLGEYVFPGGGASQHVVEIKRAWRRLCKVAGLTDLRIHDLRHSFASQLVSDGASLPLIGALLGHSNPSTTGRYAHMFVDPQRRAVESVGAAIAAAGRIPAKEPRQRVRGQKKAAAKIRLVSAL